jgi:hypothetical protein
VHGPAFNTILGRLAPTRSESSILATPHSQRYSRRRTYYIIFYSCSSRCSTANVVQGPRRQLATRPHTPRVVVLPGRWASGPCPAWLWSFQQAATLGLWVFPATWAARGGPGARAHRLLCARCDPQQHASGRMCCARGNGGAWKGRAGCCVLQIKSGRGPHDAGGGEVLSLGPGTPLPPGVTRVKEAPHVCHAVAGCACLTDTCSGLHEPRVPCCCGVKERESERGVPQALSEEWEANRGCERLTGPWHSVNGHARAVTP